MENGSEIVSAGSHSLLRGSKGPLSCSAAGAEGVKGTGTTEAPKNTASHATWPGKRARTCSGQRLYCSDSQMQLFFFTLQHLCKWDISYNPWHLEAMKCGSCSTNTHQRSSLLDAKSTEKGEMISFPQLNSETVGARKCKTNSQYAQHRGIMRNHIRF